MSSRHTARLGVSGIALAIATFPWLPWASVVGYAALFIASSALYLVTTPVADHVALYALRIARATRPGTADAPEFAKEYITWGAGPRASQCLVLGAKARAVLHGRFHATNDDIRAIAHPVLRHRISTNFQAQAEGSTTEDIIERVIQEIPEPEIPKFSSKPPAPPPR